MEARRDGKAAEKELIAKDMLAGQYDDFFVGSLNPDEYAVFNNLVESGFLARWYEGAAGMLGLAKVRPAQPKP